MQANYAFHDVIYRAAELPLVERLAKGARRTFIGDRVVEAPGQSSTSCTRRTTSSIARSARRSAAGSAQAARVLAREHVLSSSRLIEVVLETLDAGGREPGWG